MKLVGVVEPVPRLVAGPVRHDRVREQRRIGGQDLDEARRAPARDAGRGGRRSSHPRPTSIASSTVGESRHACTSPLTMKRIASGTSTRAGRRRTLLKVATADRWLGDRISRRRGSSRRSSLISSRSRAAYSKRRSAAASCISSSRVWISRASSSCGSSARSVRRARRVPARRAAPIAAGHRRGAVAVGPQAAPGCR